MSVLPEGEGAALPKSSEKLRERPDIWVPRGNGKSSPLMPSLADWLTLRAPSAIFEGDRIDLICQRKTDKWKIQTMAYYKDGKKLHFSNEVFSFSIPSAVLSDSGSYSCSATVRIYLRYYSKKSNSIKIQVQGKAFLPVGARLEETVAEQGGSLEGKPAPTPHMNQSPVV